MSKIEFNPNWVLHRAYIFDGKLMHVGEAVALACLLRSKGESRKSDDMTKVQKIMADRNVRK